MVCVYIHSMNGIKLVSSFQYNMSDEDVDFRSIYGNTHSETSINIIN